jgi:O-antigen biosynthesis protein
MLLGEHKERSALLGKAHPLALERHAALALSAQDFVTAFACADRRCRIEPPPTANCFVLRAEAAWRLGRHQAALDDLLQALEIDPAHLPANRRMLAWSKDEASRDAATRLITYERDPAVLKVAIGVLRDFGEQHWAAVSVFDTFVTGWVAWTAGGQAEAIVTSGETHLASLLDPDPFHTLASAGVQATGFRIRRPPSADPQRLALNCLGAKILQRRLPPNVGSLRLLGEKTAKVRSTAVPNALPTVIVPVYVDREATIACFEALLKSGATFTSRTTNPPKGSFRVLAVDDASPDFTLRAYLRQLAREERIDLLVNSANLGFVGAINRALSEVVHGDVVLLNADTMVSPGFVERLATSVYSEPNIGTATPLSNNGDIFSFPRPGFENPVPSYDDLVALDQATATANGTSVVDTPSGIGFCLYITRDCLDAVGGLSESFERGYLEDVDFCLRAREHGFRNVCAAGVYVAHHGSKSFKREKRSLVLRNLAVIDQRFPSYRRECLAFEAADPLKTVRSRLERVLPSPNEQCVLIPATSGTSLALAKTRARQLIAAGERPVLIVRHDGTLWLQAYDGTHPQQTALDITAGAERAAVDALRKVQPSRLEIIDANLPPPLLQLIRRLELPLDLWITSERSLSHIDLTSGLYAPTELAAAFARTRQPDHQVLVRPWPVPRVFMHERRPGGKRTVAVVPASASAGAFQTSRALAARFLEHEVQIVVAGATTDDQGLMSFPNVFVTGEVEADGLGDLLSAYDPSWILTDFEGALFGHPLVDAARSANRPVAYRDWSLGAIGPRESDLAIAPYVCETELADVVARWIGA